MSIVTTARYNGLSSRVPTEEPLRRGTVLESFHDWHEAPVGTMAQLRNGVVALVKEHGGGWHLPEQFDPSYTLTPYQLDGQWGFVL